MQNVPLYLKKAGFASRNIVHVQKNILRCVGSSMKIGIRNFILRMRSRSVMAGTEGATALKMREQRSEVQNYVPK